ncbi:MAG: hypothetical protein LEGION0398_MBIBDBAK_00929 [Legionellaceae bacterium]
MLAVLKTTFTSQKMSRFFDITFVKNTTLIMLGVFALAITAQLRIPLQPVPLTFQSVTVLLIGVLYGMELGLITVLGYLTLGAFGLPVFANMSSGFNILLGATSGYLVGFIPAVAISAYFTKKGWMKSFHRTLLANSMAIVVIFTLGVSVLANFIGWKNAFLGGVMPFIFTETLKVIALSIFIPSFLKKKD